MKKILRLMQKPTPPCTAIVVAAGSSRRMGGVDKLTADLAGSPLVLWSLRAMEDSQTVGSVILVVQADRLAEFAALTANAGLIKLRQVVAGGPTRADSVRAGLSVKAGGSPVAGTITVDADPAGGRPNHVQTTAEAHEFYRACRGAALTRSCVASVYLLSRASSTRRSIMPWSSIA